MSSVTFAGILTEVVGSAFAEKAMARTEMPIVNVMNLRIFSSLDIYFKKCSLTDAVLKANFNGKLRGATWTKTVTPISA
jgi:hypothetical protein